VDRGRFRECRVGVGFESLRPGSNDALIPHNKQITILGPADIEQICLTHKFDNHLLGDRIRGNSGQEVKQKNYQCL
jgi:hypothetical protein